MVGSKHRWSVLLAVVAGAALLLAACGGSNNKSSSSSAGGLTDLGKQLPSSVQQAKEIKVGSDIEYPPVEFFKEGTQEVQGIDWDIAQALAKKLGVKFTFVNFTDFANMITAMQAKRFDIIMSAMNDTAERRAKNADFIDYFSAGSAILVKKGNPQGVQSLDSLCGKTVALQQGTVQVDQAKAQNAKCKTAGTPEIKILTFEKDTDALLQVKNGRAVADMEDFPVAAYNAKTSGGGSDFEVAGQQFEVGKYGIAVRKDDTQLRDALQAALKAVIADGTYDQILSKWGVQQGALKTAPLNSGS